ncbi:LEAF RUST 10 DISEASE-RESISTANCE LOCUS RECEPTOR-LIKE PROTEIN KINASE-like 2.7 [Eucalyptus grandis]|uniref:LEAF RUST 10 DISEASE-RESISTANCE LOCUS RECEPTOR-LIKE PROTEIN KINASE-like 2.7 n=1 Tax=Eucalyptus grandis TaxID=71139 RepID=UPI00192E7B5E|nr:LEAF RUST 10 DISEASE-RESISTANCE LOCUS RECEPTOR-LIKE PROTEIN KINASE-like 2.7 [Eucalyptus grandis]
MGTERCSIARALAYILFLSILVVSTLSVTYEDCEATRCSRSGPNISYPFFVAGSGQELCGYPGFKVRCEGGEIMYGSFPIRSISYEKQSFRLATRYMNDTGCFVPRPNTYYHYNLFQKSSSQYYLKFFYGCTDTFSTDLPQSRLNCTSDQLNYTFVLLTHGEELAVPKDGDYNSSSRIPVELKEGIPNPTINSVDYRELLKDGFALDWTLLTNKGCAKCIHSGGRCGRSKDRDFVCHCSDGSSRENCDAGKGNSLLKKGAIVTSLCGVCAVAMILAYLCKKRFCNKKSMVPWSKKMNGFDIFEVAFENDGMPIPRRYSYAEIKRMTNSFKEKLGQGGYGSVYKGNLPNGRLVAVKILSTLRGNDEEFINEVNSIRRTSHVNIVNLLGFCFHKSKRALVYEFMASGSLEKFIYEDNYSKLGHCHLGWDTLYQISLGIAQGLEYLHRGCNSRILHFDIKPHNILLDENYHPKISDFGLAKICHQDESTISLFGARGTVGFIAPEVFCRNIGGISHKSDVYSFGMTVLEMVGGRKNIVAGVDRTSEAFFPHLIHKRLELQEELGLQNIVNEGDREKARKMIIVSLWCIQTNPSNRPMMSEVVDKLRGSVDCLQVPPKPYLSSPSISLPTSSMSMTM